MPIEGHCFYAIWVFSKLMEPRKIMFVIKKFIQESKIIILCYSITDEDWIVKSKSPLIFSVLLKISYAFLGVIPVVFILKTFSSYIVNTLNYHENEWILNIITCH